MREDEINVSIRKLILFYTVKMAIDQLQEGAEKAGLTESMTSANVPKGQWKQSTVI